MVEELDGNTLSSRSTGKDISIVDFWAPWCKPCTVSMPDYEALSNEMEHDFYKVNVAHDTEIAMAYGVLSVPTIVVLKGTEKVGSIEGAHPKARLRTKLEEIIRRI